MSHEYSDAEMYPCDCCGEYLPVEEMYELEDGRIVCSECLEEINESTGSHFVL